MTALTGSTFVVAEDASALGAGWGIEGVDRLVAVSGGVYLVTGSGAFEEFTTGGTSGGVTSYNSPPNDFGALTSTGSGGSLAYLYTATDGVKWTFNSSGLLTDIEDLDSLHLTYSYDGSNRLDAVQSPDGSVANLYYGSGQVVISEPQTLTFTGSADQRQLLAGVQEAHHGLDQLQHVGVEPGQQHPGGAAGPGQYRQQQLRGGP